MAEGLPIDDTLINKKEPRKGPLFPGMGRVADGKTVERMRDSAKALREALADRKAQLDATIQQRGYGKFFSNFVRNVPKSMIRGAVLSTTVISLIAYLKPDLYTDVLSNYVGIADFLPLILGSAVGSSVGQITGNFMEKRHWLARGIAMMATGAIAGLATSVSVLDVFYAWHASSPPPGPYVPLEPVVGKEGIPDLVTGTEVAPEAPPIEASAPEVATVAPPVGEAAALLPNPTIQGSGSLASELMQGIKRLAMIPEKGLAGSFVEVVIKTIENEKLQSLVLERAGKPFANAVAWTAIPDGTTLNFARLFSDPGFALELKEMIEHGPYKTLAKHIAESGMSVDQFIQKFARAYGA